MKHSSPINEADQDNSPFYRFLSSNVVITLGEKCTKRLDYLIPERFGLARSTSTSQTSHYIRFTHKTGSDN